LQVIFILVMSDDKNDKVKKIEKEINEIKEN
jgi:hypothetical protein